LEILRLRTAWLDGLFRPTNNCFRWGVFALTGLCFIKRQSLQPSEEIRAIDESAGLETHSFSCCPEGTSVFLSQVSAQRISPSLLAAGCSKQRQLLFCLDTFSCGDHPKRLCYADYCEKSWRMGNWTTELVINSLKRAFSENTKDGQITVSYDVSGTDWKLSIADNGVGKPDGVFAQPKTGLGTGIVKALAQQLGAKVETLAGPEGTTVSVTHATFLAKMPRVV